MSLGFGIGDMFFGGFSIFFIIVFLLVFGMILMTFIKGISQWNSNNHSPRLSVEASVVGKRADTSYHDGNDHSMGHTSTSYYVTFEVKSGDRMEFVVSGKEYGMLIERDFGELTFQGTRYLGFVRR